MKLCSSGYHKHVLKHTFDNISIFRSRLPLWFLALGAVCAALSGCARFPQGSTVSGKRLTIQFDVRGRIRSSYFYLITIRNANDPTGVNGPKPVLNPPWGNGYAAGSFHYVLQYSAAQVFGDATLYQITNPDEPLLRRPVGAPLSVSVSPDGRRLTTTLDFAQIAKAGQQATDIRFLQINIIATDRIPLNPMDGGAKNWDALGDARDPLQINSYLNLRVDTNGVWVGGSAAAVAEPSDDVFDRDRLASNIDPDLDIVAYRIEVR